MIIRSGQMDALDFLGLEGHLVEHLRRFARDHVESIGNDGLREVVRLGIQRAAGFGWKKRGPVEFYLEVMVMLGSDFDTDPQYPWARASLRTSLEEMAGADHLHAELMKYYDAALGPGLFYEVEAIQRLLESDYAKACRLSVMTESELLQLIDSVFPQKYAYVGEAAIGALIEEARDVCSRFGIAETGLALVTAILFVFGHSCFGDPQYPWILASTTVQGGTQEAALHRAFKRYLQEALLNMEKG